MMGKFRERPGGFSLITSVTDSILGFLVLFNADFLRTPVKAERFLAGF